MPIPTISSTVSPPLVSGAEPGGTPGGGWGDGGEGGDEGGGDGDADSGGGGGVDGGGGKGGGVEGGPTRVATVPTSASLVMPGDSRPMGSCCCSCDDEGEKTSERLDSNTKTIR